MEDLKTIVRARYGENHPISGDYDRSLAVKCVNGTFVGVKGGDIIAYKGIFLPQVKHFTNPYSTSGLSCLL